MRGVAHAPGVPAPRTVVYVRLSDIRPASRNPRTHVIPDIVESIRTFGLTGPLLRCDRTGQLAFGHGRAEALVSMKAAGDPLPDGLVLDDDGEWCVPVTTGWRSRNDRHLEAYLVADNRLTELGGWDKYLLAEVLQDIATDAPGLLDAMAITSDDLDDMLAGVNVDPYNPDDASSTSVAEDDGDTTGDRPRPPLVECPSCGHTFSPDGAQ